MSCEKALGFAVFNRSEYSQACCGVRLPIQEDVEYDVGIQEQALLHRYFLTRCLR